MFEYGFCGGYWWLVPLVMLLFCFLFMRRCLGARRCCAWGGDYGSRESAMDVLRKRYASGEIDHREYEEKKKTLSHQ